MGSLVVRGLRPELGQLLVFLGGPLPRFSLLAADLLVDFTLHLLALIDALLEVSELLFQVVQLLGV